MTTYEVDKKILEGLDVTIQQNGEDVSIQNPLPTDGDSVYVKDIDTTYSDNGNFSGYVTDYFDSLKTINNDITANNPKTIKVWFNRTVYSHSIGIGCDDLDSGFGTDVTVKLLGSGEAIRFTKQFTGIDKNSALLEFGSKAFNGFILEFNTASIVSLSNITIQKAVEGNNTIHGENDNGEIDTVGITNKGQFKVSVEEYGDTPAIDAFDRLRTSEPFTLFDSKQLHDKQPLFWDEAIGGSATSVHSSVNAETKMSVTASASDYVIRQTKQRFNYQPGKSQLILMTFHSPQDLGATKRAGLFDGTGTNNLTANNGIFFECDGALSWNIAKDGTTAETVTQDSWNVDTLDGNGVSGITLDMDGTQIIVIDYEWLGVGRVRVGFVIDGLIIYCHYFNHSNDATYDSVYMSTPNLPLRYEITTDGTTATHFDHICSSVMSEGGLEKTGILRGVDNGTSYITSLNTGIGYALLNIRLKDAYKDITVIPESMGAMAGTNDDFRWSLNINATIDSTLTWNDIDNSAVQVAYGVKANDVTDDGIVIASGYGSKSVKQLSETLNTALKIGTKIDGTADILSVVITPITNNLSVLTNLEFRELL